HADEQAKQAVIEPEITAEKKESEQSLGATEAAVLAHGVVDPVTGAGVPEDAARVAHNKSLPGRGGTQPDGTSNLEFARWTRAQQSHKQWGECEPGQNIHAGKRKDDDLQNRRKHDQEPGAEVDLAHGQG